MKTYEDFIEDLEYIVPDLAQNHDVYDDALEAACSSMAFIKLLNDSLRENGATLPEQPDVDEIGTVLDKVFAELAAASLFLSEPSFARVPDMLRSIADGIEKTDQSFVDPSGEDGKSVPPVVVQGFRDFARRLEATKLQKQQMVGALKKVDSTEETC